MLPEAMAPALSETGVWTPPELEPPTHDDRINTSFTYGFVFDMCGVEIDPVTYQVRVDRYVSMHDAGRILNSTIADGQIRGAFAQGVAAALYEEFTYNEEGAFLSGTFADYLVPTVSEIPDVEILHYESPSPFTPLGAKGLAEGNCMSTPVCIANAIADALGVDDVALPATPRRIHALMEGGRQMKPRPFDYVRPDTVEEAVALLAEYGDDARILAGGQSLVPMLNLRLVDARVLIDISRIAELDAIRDLGAAIEVGAAVTQNKLMAWPGLRQKLPLVAAALPFVGHFQTRNRGTVCGSIAHADPSSELPLALAVLGGDGGAALAKARRARARRRGVSEGHAHHGARGRRADHRRALSGRSRARALRFAKSRGGTATSPSSRSRRSPTVAARCSSASAAWRGGRWCARLTRRCGRRRRRLGGGTRRLRRPARIGGDAARYFPKARAGRDRGGDDDAPRERKTSALRVALTLNGRKLAAEAEPRLLLSDFLRQALGATGTHVGCEHGVCGSCTVLIDGVAQRSCLTLAVQAEGRDVRTVESLAAADGTLNALQAAFRNNHALQCGFCTPGILMSFTDFLARNPHPTEAEIRDVLSGHLCRCTGYANIVAAIKEAAGTD